MEMTPHGSFERCCRLCAEEQEVTIMIFGEEAEAMLLKNKLKKYLLIEVEENDKLPKNICIRCCTNLQKVCQFIDTARNSQALLTARSMMLDELPVVEECTQTTTITEIKCEPQHDDSKCTEMEISVDPMIVLQNSEATLSPNIDDNNCRMISNDPGDITYLHGLDGENVTIKLIKKGESGEDDCVDGNIVKVNTVSNNLGETSDKPFPCVTCSRGFVTELALKNHSWMHVSDEKCRQYKCTTCEESFDYKSDLIAHLKTHKSNGMCQLCGRVFRSERNLIAHMAVHLSSGKSYTCKVCLRSYNTLSNLKTHSVTHSNERPFECNVCQKSFKRNQDLKFHINQHTGAKPYKCPFCEKCFASSGNCYSHRSRMHPDASLDSKSKKWNTSLHPIVQFRPIAPKPTVGSSSAKGVYRYQCKICSHSFLRRDNFNYHMYQHTGEKPFQCTFCSEKFVTRRGLLLHHDKKHNTKERPLALISRNVLLK